MSSELACLLDNARDFRDGGDTKANTKKYREISPDAR